MPERAYPVTVRIPSLPPTEALLRPLDGEAEAAVSPGRAGEATRLLAKLASAADGRALDWSAIPVAVHDRLLAALYVAEYGEEVSCQATCRACAQPFRFSFALPALLASQDEAAAAAAPAPQSGGFWTAPSGRRLRAPTLADGQAGDPLSLLSRLSPDPIPAGEEEEAAAFLESAAPILSVDLDADCPNCSAPQSIAFDLGRFLVEAIAAERPFLIRETHLIAARYGWSHGEIMALPRADRRAFAALIETERSASLRHAS